MLNLKEISKRLNVGIIYSSMINIDSQTSKNKSMTFVNLQGEEYQQVARWGKIILPGFEMFNECLLINFDSNLTPNKIKNYYAHVIFNFMNAIENDHQKVLQNQDFTSSLLKYNAGVLWSLNQNKKYHMANTDIQWI